MRATAEAQPNATAGAQARVTLSCRVPEALRQRLRVAAVTRGSQMADIVGEALRRELDRLDAERGL